VIPQDRIGVIAMNDEPHNNLGEPTQQSQQTQEVGNKHTQQFAKAIQPNNSH
jgi:hypothetical protein